MMEAIEAAVSSERGATGAAGVEGEAQGVTFHMNQSSGGSGSTDGEGGGESMDGEGGGRRGGGCSPPSRSGAKGVVVLPHIACMSAFHSA